MSAITDVRALYLACCIGALAMSACGGTAESPPVVSTGLAGWYVRDSGATREVIDLRPNGDYMHVIAIRGGAARTDAAHWHAIGDSIVTLDFYRAAADVGHGVAKPDSVRIPVRADSAGDLRLEVPSDSVGFVRRLRYVPTPTR